MPGMHLRSILLGRSSNLAAGSIPVESTAPTAKTATGVAVLSAELGDVAGGTPLDDELRAFYPPINRNTSLSPQGSDTHPGTTEGSGPTGASPSTKAACAYEEAADGVDAHSYENADEFNPPEVSPPPPTRPERGQHKVRCGSVVKRGCVGSTYRGRHTPC